MRCSTGGCVEKRLARLLAGSGREDVEGVQLGVRAQVASSACRSMPLEIFSSAEASALGRPVISGRAAVGGELAVARQRLHEDERHDVDDERDEDQHHGARAVVVVADEPPKKKPNWRM